MVFRTLGSNWVNCYHRYPLISHGAVGEAIKHIRSIHGNSGHFSTKLRMTSAGISQLHSRDFLRSNGNYTIHVRDFSIRHALVILSENISSSYPVQKCTQTLIWFHDTTGLPWYASIILSTILFRTLVVFPFQLYNQHIDARLQKLGPVFRHEVDKTKVLLGEQVARGELDPKSAKKKLLLMMQNFAREKYIEHNVHPGQKIILICFQMPLWVFMSFSLGNMTWRPITFLDPTVRESMSREGMLWFKDLTEVDSLLIMPATNFLLMVFALQFHNLVRIQNGQPDTKLAMMVRRGFLLWLVFITYVSTFLPSGVLLYWMVSAANGNVVNFLLSYNRFRRFFRLPPTNIEPLNLRKLLNARNKYY